MFCTNCGTKNNEGVAFCTNCGERMKQAGGNTAPAPQSPPPVVQQTYQPAPPPTGQQPYGASPPPYSSGMSTDAPGKNFLLVTGIICIIGASISIISSISSLATIGQLMVWVDIGGLRAVFVFTLLGGIYQLILGISGVRYCNVLEKGNMLYNMGMAALLIPLIVLITTIAIAGASFGFVGAIGFILPILYIIGAKKNKDAAR